MFGQWQALKCMQVAATIVLMVAVSSAHAVMISNPVVIGGNTVTQVMPISGPNALQFYATFEESSAISFTVNLDSSDDPFAPIAITGLFVNSADEPWSAITMSFGGATINTIGDAHPGGTLNANVRGTVAELLLDAPLLANTRGAFGENTPWLVNTHGAMSFTITLAPSTVMAAQVPEPSTWALMITAVLLGGALRGRTHNTKVRVQTSTRS